MITTTTLLKRAIAFLGIIIITLNTYSQSPGGVSGFAAWYRGDVGLTAATWSDQSANGYHLTGANSPVVTNLINFNPVATFNNGSSQQYNSSASAKTNWPVGNAAGGFTYYYVARLNDVSTGSRQVALGIGGTTNGFHSGREENALNISASTTAYSPNDASTVRVSTFAPTWGTNSVSLVRAGKNAAASAPIYISANGSAESVSGNLTPNYSNTDVFRIGLAGNNFDRWVGSVGEVIVYSGKHNAANYDRIESYLAIKYGITKAGDYLNSAGSPIWSSTVNAGYLNNIAGIVRDDAGALHQRQSMSVGTLEQVLIGTTGMANTNAANAVNLVNGQSLIWGDNGLSRGPAVKITGVPGVNYRFAAIWKAQNIGNVGTVRVMWPAIYSSMRLIQSADATIDASDVVTDMANTQTINGVTYRYADVTISDGQFFSFAVQFNAPGGVAANLRMWLKSDAGVTTSGSNVTQWSNQTPVIANFVPGNAGLQPSLNANGLNFNPSVNFYPSASQKSLGWGSGSSGSVASMFSNSDPMTFLYVARSTNASVKQTIVQRPSADRPAVEWNNYSSGYRFGLDLDGTDFENDGYHLSATIAANTPYILASGFNYQPTATGQIFNSMNGGALHTQNGSTNIAANNEAWSLGSADRIGTAEGFQGEIMEVIGYNTYLNTPSTLQQIQSYLAIKYGITLQQPLDYLNSSGAVVWTNSANSGYANNIAGVGRDDDAGLYQKQSMSVNAGQQLLIGVGGALANTNILNANTINNGQYLIWGDNGSAKILSYPIANVAGVNYIMAATWKIQNTNTLGVVRVMWPQGISSIKLIVSSDAIFTNTDDVYDMSANTQTINGVTYNYADVTLADGKFFTFAGYACAPGGVVANLKAWYNAGSLAQANNTTVTNLPDITGNGFNMVRHTNSLSLNAPTYLTNTVNFNPTIKFDGGYDAFFYNNRFYQLTDNGSQFFGATTNAATNDKILADHGFYDPYVGHNGSGNARLYHDPGQTFAFTENPNVTVQNGIPFVAQYGWTYSAAGTGDPDGRSLAGFNGDIFTRVQQQFSNISNDFGGRLTLGALGDNGAYWWDGNISEAIYYSRDLTNNERQRVNSYLAIKYGVTLKQPFNYLSSLDSTVWDATKAPAYNNNIFGIARDFSSCFTQNVSASVNPNTIVTIATTNNFIAANSDAGRIPMNLDQQYLMIGDNNVISGFTQITTPTCPLIEPGEIMLDRKWYVQRTNDTSGKYIQIDLSAYPLNSKIRLMLASDAGFTTDVALVPALSYSGGKAVFYVAFPRYTYFTVVGSQVTPPCTTCTGGSQVLENGKIWSTGGFTATSTNTVLNAPLKGTAPQSGALTADVRIFDPGNVEFLPNYYPLWAGNRVLLVRYDNKAGDAGKMTYSVKLKSGSNSISSKASFQISGITEWVRTMASVTVVGYCGGEIVRPKLTHAYNSTPALNAALRSFTINSGTSTMTAFKHGGALTPWSSVNVNFEKPVDSITVSWTRSTYYPFKVLSYLYISDMTFVCDNVKEPTPDNVNVITSYQNNDLLGCQEALLKLDFVNDNCVTKTINVSNTLPAGIEYVPDSYSGIDTETPTYAGQSFTLNNLVLQPGTSTAYIKVKASNPLVSGTYNSQFSFTVQGGINSPNPYLSDDISGQSGFQPVQLTFTAAAKPILPGFTVTAKNTVSNDSTYVTNLSLPGETIEYTYTFNNTTGSPVTGLDLTDQLNDSAYFVANSIVASPGITYTANGYGSTGEEKLLNLLNLTVPTGISTIKVSAISRNSSDTIRNIASLSIPGTGECGNSTMPLSDSTKIIPICYRNGLLVPINTSLPVTITSNCIDNGWIYYVNTDRKAVIAIRPNGTNWNPDEITIDATPFVNKKVNGSLDSAVVMQRLYTIKHSGAISNPVDVRLYYSPTELTSQVPATAYSQQTWFKHSGTKTDIETDLTPTGLTGPAVTPLTPNATGTEFGINYVQFNGISSFSTFGYKGNTVKTLPVNLILFEARKNGDKAVLNWTTADETNNKGFEILHSRDGARFEVIGWVEGKGTTGNMTNYQFIHSGNASGKHYYRLRQVDFDGFSILSNIAVVDFGKINSRITISPNPTTQNVLIDGIQEFESVSLRDATGKNLFTRKLNHENRVELKVTGYGKGVYLVVLYRKDGKFETYKLTVL